MQKFTFRFFGALICALLLSACAAQQEDPAVEARQSDTMTSEILRDTSTIVAAAPRPHTEPDRENYMLRSDTALFVRENSALSIVVRGPLGNGCQRYEYMDSVRSGNTLFLTFWASRPTDPNVICTEQMQAYDRLVRIESSPYTRLAVLQPDGSTRSYAISE